MEGANIYAVIKSCISTYKKNGINLYDALKSIFTDNPILVQKQIEFLYST